MSGDGNGGFREGMESSQGDPRLVLLLNLVLSTAFAWTVVWGLDLVGALEFSFATVATGALLVFALTYFVVQT